MNECKECGACTNACPLNEYDENYIVYKIFFGPEKGFKLWTRCCSCFLCEENCPYGLNPREEIFKIRRNSDRSNIPPRIIKYYENIKRTGFVFNIDEYVNEERIEYGLVKLNLDRIKSEVNKLFNI